MRMWTRAVALGAMGLAAGGALGCAEERAPINRVQPDALAKSFFVGNDLVSPQDDPEFYAQATVVDVGYGAGADGLFTSTYAQPLTRIKWEIREDQLIGRETYQRIATSDGKGNGPASVDGQVAYVYPIKSQFDIRRDYNPATGEESNVIVENATDRPWYEREYMRVDWSQNLAKDGYDFDTLSLLGLYGGVSYEPLAYYVNNPDDPDAPHFNPKAGYFDVTNKAFAQPGLIDLSGLGWGINKFPSCMLENDFFGGSAPAGNCNPVELTLRQAFRKVEKSDYEPVDYDGIRFDAFGIFTTDRYGYARDYGMTDQNWHRFASRYNIWEKSHAYVPVAKGAPSKEWQVSQDFPDQYEVPCNTPTTVGYGGDANADADKDGTADACAAVTAVYGGGSQCDGFKQKCTAPYAVRKAVPIVWHVAKNSNPEFFEGTQWAAQEWDVGMRVTVQAAKYAECMRVNNQGDAASTDATCLSQFPIYQGQQDDNQDAVALATEVDTCRNVDHKSEPECKALADSIGAQRGYSAGVIAVAKMDEMLVLCHSPVESTDSPLCADDIKTKDPIDGDTRQVLPAGKTAADCDAVWYPTNPAAKIDQTIKTICDNGFTVRQGDMRFHQVNLIKEPQTPSPWGIMTDSDDPLTGEKVAASINVWTHVNDLASQSAIDIMRYIKGELQTADITDGKYVRDWASAAGAAGANGVLGTMSKATLDARFLASTDGRSLQNGEAQVKAIPTLPDDVVAKLDAFRKSDGVADIRASASVTPSSATFINARRLAAQNTPTEASIITPAMMQLTAPDLATLNSAGQVNAENITDLQGQASLLRNLNPAIQQTFRQAKEIALAKRGACILSSDEATAPAPNALTGLAAVLERKFSATYGNFGTGSADDQQTRAEAMRHYIAQRYQYGVIIHEMGHSIGLRHNFVSSAYAWGYRPQYWQLRTKNGAVTQQCADATTDGESCVGPRYFDPTTKEETDNLIWMFMQSSVMDYPGEITQDMNGLGAYDFAAARMFYGDVVSVHQDASYNAGKLGSKVMLSVMNNFGGITGYEYTDGPNKYHYSALQDKLKLIQNCTQVSPLDFQPTHWDESKYGTWDPLIDGLIVQVNGQYTRCKQQPVSYVQYNSLRAPTTGELGGTNGVRLQEGTAIDQFNRTRVPYGFASDDWADVGNLSVFRHDNGADAYELFNFFITEQETRHIFDNYRRSRTSFSVKAASTRILERYNEKMRDAAKGVGLYSNIYRDFFSSLGIDFDKGGWAGIANVQFHDAIIASGIAFDHFTRQMQRPESGDHQLLDGVLRAQDYAFGNPGASVVVIPDGATGYFGQVSPGGKLLENQLSQTAGDYDRDYTLNAGSYYDKVYAPFLLTESVDNFISSSRQDFLDARYRNVSMADLFPDGYRRMLANNLTGDDFIKGPRVAALASGNVDVDTDKFPKQGIGFTSWWTPTPEACFPGPNNIICTSFGCPEGNICDVNPQTLVVAGLHPTNPDAPANVMALDPEVDWEQQKFLVAQTLLYLPENAKEDWINSMGIWEQGSDSDPQFENRIELHLPDGKVYIAQTYGTEVIFGKTVQRGIGARVLEYANQLVKQSYVTTTGGQNGVTWYIPTVDANGKTSVLFDPSVQQITPDPTCSAGDNSGCVCSSNKACTVLAKYESVPAYIRQAMHDFRMADATMKGIYQ